MSTFDDGGEGGVAGDRRTGLVATMRRIAAEELRRLLPDDALRMVRELADFGSEGTAVRPRAAAPRPDTSFGPGDYLVHKSYGKVTARCYVDRGGQFIYFKEPYTSATLVAKAAAKRLNQKSQSFGRKYWTKVSKAEWDRAKGTG